VLQGVAAPARTSPAGSTRCAESTSPQIQQCAQMPEKTAATGSRPRAGEARPRAAACRNKHLTVCFPRARGGRQCGHSRAGARRRRWWRAAAENELSSPSVLGIRRVCLAVVSPAAHVCMSRHLECICDVRSTLRNAQSLVPLTTDPGHLTSPGVARSATGTNPRVFFLHNFAGILWGESHTSEARVRGFVAVKSVL
jgi:hypothetical protein